MNFRLYTAKLFSVFFIFNSLSCSTNKQDALSISIPGKNITIPEETRLHFLKVPIDDIGFFKAFTTDSLYIIQTVENNATLIKVFNAKTLEVVRETGQQGQGPSDFINLSTNGQIETSAQDAYLWVSDNANKKIRKINVSQTASETIIDREYTYHGDFFNIYHLYDSTFIGDIFDGKNMHLTLFDTKENEYKTIFSFFEETEYIKDISLTGCNTTLKPDKTKIAYSMLCFNNLIISSISTGKTTSVSINSAKAQINNISNSPFENRIIYHGPLTSTNNQIWGIFSNKQINNEESSKIIVYDWNGDPLYSFNSNIELTYIHIDTASKILYGVDPEMELYKCDVSNYIL